GRVTDDNLLGLIGSANNIATVALDVNNDGSFNNADDVRTSNFDAMGNFSITIPNLLPGTYTVNARATDNAGNSFTTSITFVMQGTGNTEWSAIGPNPISVAGTGVNYSTVSGKVTALAIDESDATGNSYYLGSDNGGIWKTTDGGQSWTP